MAKKSNTGLALTPQQEQAIFLLTGGTNQTETAKTVGVSVETVNRWLNGRDNPAFVAAYNATRQAVLDQAAGKLTALYDQAIDTLLDLMVNARDKNIRMKIALAIVNSGPPPVGETDPELLAKEWQAIREEKTGHLAARIAFSGMSVFS
jgi:transcriptional regulator with XRE-family HTH domain